MDILEKESIKNALIQIIAERNYKNHEISIASGSKPGDNYGGDVYKILITNNSSKLNLFIKVPRESARENFNVSEYFQREEILYTEILPTFLSFQNEKIVNDKFKSVAKCYSACSVENSEYIIMSDLSVDGFVLRDKFETIDFNHCKLVMQELGKLHAFSFALNDQYPEFLASYKDKMPELMFRNPISPSFAAFLEPFVTFSKIFLEVEEQYKEQWNNFIENYISHAQFCCDGTKAEPYRIITHGDTWTNNILYRYENEEPVDMRILDFQLSRFVSPVIDLVQFIYTATEKSLRDAHLQKLLQIYHDTLSNFIYQLGSDPEKLFPYSVFQDQLKKFGKYGLCISLMGTQVIYLLEDNKITENVIKRKACCKRLSDIINEMAQFGYI